MADGAGLSHERSVNAIHPVVDTDVRPAHDHVGGQLKGFARGSKGGRQDSGRGEVIESMIIWKETAEGGTSCVPVKP